MCAPGDQRKSNGSQREQATLSVLRCRRRVVASGMVSLGKPRVLAGQLLRTRGVMADHIGARAQAFLESGFLYLEQSIRRSPQT